MKSKVKGLAFEDLLKKELQKKEVKILFDQMQFYLQIARLITELRARAGLSQLDLAKRAGVSQPLIARLEKGDHRRVPTFDTIYKIMKALGYTMSISVKPERGAA